MYFLDCCSLHFQAYVKLATLSQAHHVLVIFMTGYSEIQNILAKFGFQRVERDFFLYLNLQG